MSKSSLQFHRVTYFYETSSEPILDNVSVQFASGWTGIIGGNGAGKTTFLRPACGQLTPTQGKVQTPQNTVYCDQRTDEMPAAFSSFLQSSEAYACRLRGQLNLQSDWPSRWRTLSHGERKRVQIAIALWQRPHVLALDEPTNHIDLPTRQLLMQSLTQFQRIGLLVSHDQELLVTPTDRIGIIGPNGAGKSTLIRHLVKRKAISESRLVYIPQEIETDQAYQILCKVRKKPNPIQGDIFSYVACLGSDARRLLETERPSPGELRKLKLALGITEIPYLIVMDEPTNHLDLPSIKALEKALSVCNCALILVSHNLHFLKSVVMAIWQLTPITADDRSDSVELRILPIESLRHPDSQVFFSVNTGKKEQ